MLGTSRNSVGRACISMHRKPAMGRASWHCLVMSEAHHTIKRDKLNFYGFRPGRSCWDAIAAVFHRMKFRPQYTRKVDIAKCFDRIDHTALLAKLQAPPGIRRHVRGWLRSGTLEADTLSPTTAGTAQGGSGSPLWALIALHGIEEAITHVYPEARVIAYADDCLVLHPDRAVLAQSQQLLTEGLAGLGLTLNTSKTR